MKLGILNIFKLKKEGLSLEKLLQKAAQEPSYRAEFYRKIIAENLIILTEESGMPNGTKILDRDTNVKIRTLENGIIPVFTSEERILDSDFVKTKVHFMAMNSKTIFEITKGATLFLNPYSDFRKELLPLEIERILDGTIITENHQQLTIKNDTEVQIGQPIVYPTEIINSLITLFQNRTNVNKAYLGWINNPQSPEPPHYIFGIDANGDFQNLIDEAGFTVKEFLKTPEFVDFIKIEKKNGLSKYFINTKPFYEK